MIKPRERFFAEGRVFLGSSGNPKTPAYFNIFDWDQLRMVTIHGTAKLFPRDADAEVEIFAQYADLLSPTVCAITVDDDGLLVGISTDPKDDPTPFVPYFRHSTLHSLADCRTIRYSKLHELDRLAPGVDLSSYEDEAGNLQRVAFKFNPSDKPRGRYLAWNELHILKSLPLHPNLVTLDRVVLEDEELRLIGYTTRYIPGGTLEQNTVPFRFEWLQQLTELVDFLNLELGIMHQDIARRNLLIDPDSQKLVLFDFNWAACGKNGLLDGRDDVSAVILTVYELITNDTHFSSIPHWERSMNTVQGLPEWPRRRELDSDVSTFRNFLDKWVATRRAGGDMERYLNAPHRPTIPDLPPIQDYDIPFDAGTMVNGKPVLSRGPRYRRSAIANGQYCFRWERPPQSRSLKKRKIEKNTQ